MLYVTLSVRISVHNKSPELFTVKLESHSRRRVRHWALELKKSIFTMAQFSLSPMVFFPPPPPPLFFLSFFHLQFSYPSFFPLFPPYPLPLPTPEDFFPTSNLNLWIFHGSLPESTWFKYVHYKSVIKNQVDYDVGGGGVALVTFNSRRPV